MDYKSKWDNAMSYDQYRQLIVDLVEEGKSTGHIQTEKLFEFSKLNIQRMKRIRKTYSPELNGLSSGDLTSRIVFLTITEGWCGDAAQSIPVISNIADDLGVEHRYILRDDNPDLMDLHLSDGLRSIPILVILEKSSFRPIGQWGSRPVGAEQFMNDWKNQPEPKISEAEAKTQLQLWYNKDKQHSIQQEIISVLESL